MRRTKCRKSRKLHFQDFWDSCAQNNTSDTPKHALSGIMGVRCAEQSVGNLKKWTFRDSGTPVRRTRRRKSQKIHCQEFWDSQDVGNLKQKYTFKNSGTAVRPPDSPKGPSRPWLQRLVSFRLTESLVHGGSPIHTTPSPQPLTPNPQHLSIQHQSIGPDHGQLMSTEGQARAQGPGPWAPALSGRELAMVGPID